MCGFVGVGSGLGDGVGLSVSIARTNVLSDCESGCWCHSRKAQSEDGNRDGAKSGSSLIKSVYSPHHPGHSR